MFTVGSYVRCVDASNGARLTNGNNYKVKDYLSWRGVQVRNDYGDLSWYGDSRFVPVSTLTAATEAAPGHVSVPNTTNSFESRFMGEIKDRLEEIASDNNYLESYDLEDNDQAAELMNLADILGFNVEIQSSGIKVTVTKR